MQLLIVIHLVNSYHLYKFEYSMFLYFFKMHQRVGRLTQDTTSKGASSRGQKLIPPQSMFIIEAMHLKHPQCQLAEQEIQTAQQMLP